MKLTRDFVEEWAGKYLIDLPTYDKNYDDNIDLGRDGNRDALCKLMEWKNVSKSGHPRELWKPQKKSFQKFLSRLDTYLGKDGEAKLREDFRKSAPVYSIFWSHILFNTPIFDVYTNMAFQYFANGKRLSKNEARIRPATHWQIYNKYTVWFNREEKRLKIKHSRKLDRALFCWGKAQAEKCNRKN